MHAEMRRPPRGGWADAAALAGADVATMPFDMLEALYQHPLTADGLRLFLNDWRKVPPSKLFA